MVTLFKYAILAIFPISLYTIWIVSFTDGFGKFLIEEILPTGDLPGTPNVPFKDQFTGISFLDNVLVGFTLYYWPHFNGVTPSSAVLFVALLGMLGATSVFVFLEECRTQQFPRWTIRAVLLLMLSKSIGFAVVLPVYFALTIPAQPHHDYYSQRSNFVFVNRIQRYVSLVLFPIAVLLYLPAPTIISYDAKQQIIVLFQFVPLLLGLMMLRRGRSESFKRGRPVFPSALKSTKKSLYIFVLVLSALTYLQAALPSLAVSLGFRSLYPEDGYNDFLGMFIPRLPWHPPANVNESVLIQAQWDYLLGGVAIWLWATALLIQGRQLAKQPVSYTGVLVKGLVLSLVASPVGAAAWLLWERDEMVYRYANMGKDN